MRRAATTSTTSNPATGGASLLAKSLRALRSSRMGALSLTSIASRLAPTGPSVISDHSRRNWLFFVLYSAPAIFHLNTGHRHANSQAVI
ncbi:hypothetical protein EJA72_23555 [Pseudomonas sp. PB120]|nr:hypothetical protein [Pseudomonas sp. PB120]